MLDARKTTAVILGALGLFLCSDGLKAADQQDFAQIERGRYLTVLGDCAACHTMPQSGKPFAGGRPIETPFGNVLAANITPDRDTGIGAWTDKEFISALKSGIGYGRGHLYPAMPYVYFSTMPVSDLLAIRAYLSTVPPVHNEVHSNQLPFPFNIRWIMGVWNWLYLAGKEWQPDPNKSAEWNRGAYLVQGPMHCGACHTPKTFLGGDTSNTFEGYSIQGWHAPNITNNDELGLGNWSENQIVQYLKTGHNNVADASGPMAEAVERSTSQISDADLRAIAAFLKGERAPAPQAGTAVAASDPAMKAGQAIYKDSCSACHQEDGSGVPGLFPALRALPAVRASDPQSLIRVVIDGAKTASTDGAPTGPGMPSYAWQLSDAEVAAVLTYVRNAWGNKAGAVSKSAVKSAKGSLQKGG